MKKFLGRIVKSENFWPVLLVVIAGVLAGRSLIFESGYFNMHDDLQMMRQLQMEKCFGDLQVPCRWVPDMGYGYGFPLFNFYPPLPYLVGQIFRILQFSFVDTAKLVFALSFIASGITMYLLSKEFFGKRGGVISAVYYIWAPYHSIDIYVRGAMNEAWALVFFPIILLFSYRLINFRASNPTPSKVSNVLPLALSWVGLLLSHNLMVMIFTPVFAFWCVLWLLLSKNRQTGIKRLLFSGVIALGLAAFFTLPAVFEQKLIHVDTLTQGYYEYIAHFATIGQLLTSRWWGYGPSIWGPNDGMPFQVGHVLWITSLVIFLITLVRVVRSRKLSSISTFTVILFSIAFGWFAAFMAHQNSTPIWQRIAPLAFVQFPWRFLTLVILGFSIAAGAAAILVPKKFVNWASALLILLVIGLSWNYFKPLGGRLGPLTDEEKFAGAAWDLQRTAGIFDYLPKTAKYNPKDGPKGLAEIVEGNGTISNTSAGTNWLKFALSLDSESVIRVNVFDFPKWIILIDNMPVAGFVPEQEIYGRLHIKVPAGRHFVSIKLANTPIRSFSNSISFVSWSVLLGLAIWKKRIKST